MQVDQEVAKQVKERLLAMFTHDCVAFIRFRAILEQDWDDPTGLDNFLRQLNTLLINCGAGTNEDY